MGKRFADGCGVGQLKKQVDLQKATDAGKVEMLTMTEFHIVKHNLLASKIRDSLRRVLISVNICRVSGRAPELGFSECCLSQPNPSNYQSQMDKEA